MKVVARFTEGAGQFTGMEISLGDDGKLRLPDDRVVRASDLEAAVSAGRAEMLPDGDKAPDAEPLPAAGKISSRPAWVVPVLVSLAILAVAAAFVGGFATGRLTAGKALLPLFGGSQPATPAPEPSPEPEARPSVEQTGSLPSSTTIDASPGTSTAEAEVPTVVKGYIKGYDPTAATGVLLVYGDRGNSIPVVYDSKTRFAVDGSAVTIQAFAAAAVAAPGKPVEVLSFTVRPIPSASAVLSPAEVASLSVDPKAVTLYVVSAAAPK